MIPIYFEFISISTYGAWLATGNVIAMIGLLESNFSEVIIQKMSVTLIEKNETKFLELAGANIVTGLFMATVVFLLGFCFTPYIANWVNVNQADARSLEIAYLISLLSLAIMILVYPFGAFPQVWQDTKIIGIINLIANVLGIIITLITLFLGFGIISLGLGSLGSALIYFIAQLFWVIKKWIVLGLNFPIFKYSICIRLLKDCFFPFLSRLSDALTMQSQSFFIAFFINPTATVIFDITNKICNSSSGFVNMINGSFMGMFTLTFAKKDSNETKRILINSTKFFIMLLSTVILFSLCFSEPFIHFWVGTDKYGGNLLLCFICVAAIFTQITKYFNNIIFCYGLINKSSILDLIRMIIYISFLILTINKVGLYSIPLALIFSYGLVLFLYLNILNKEMKLNIYNLLREMLFPMILIIPFILFHFLLHINTKELSIFVLYFLSFSSIYSVIFVIINREIMLEFIRKLRKSQGGF